MATPEEAAARYLPAPQSKVSRLGPSLQVTKDRLLRSDLRFAPWVILAGLLLGPGVATEQWQYVLFIVLVTMSGALYLQWPTAGLALVVVLWTISPLIRRFLDYFVKYSSGPDILSLAPFVATLLVGVLAWRAQRPSKAVQYVLLAVVGGLIWGMPLGITNPFALVFGTAAYSAGLVGLLLGYADWKRGSLVLEKILLVLVPFIAIYGIYQFFAPQLPPWDDLWLKTDAPMSTGSKATGDLRIFSVVQSPGTLSGILSLFALMVVVAPRLGPARLLAGGVTMLALAIGQVRSAWLGMGLAMIALVPVSRGRVLSRVAVVAVILGGMYVVVGGSSAGQAVSARAGTLTDVTSDNSFQERLESVQKFGPQALISPLGHGIGSVSQASRVSLKGPPPFEDNGYLLVMWQVGLLGFLLIYGGLLAATIYGTRNLNQYKRRERFPLFAVVVVMAVFSISGDIFYGLPAVIMWYCVGALMASAEDPGRQALVAKKRARQAAANAPAPPIGGYVPRPAAEPRRSSPVA